MEIKREKITIKIDQKTSPYGNNKAVAYLDGEKIAVGHVPGTTNRAYSRIEFNMKPPKELYEQADSCGRFVDTEYDEPEESINKRPVDTCTFELTSDETQAITDWRK